MNSRASLVNRGVGQSRIFCTFLLSECLPLKSQTMPTMAIPGIAKADFFPEMVKPNRQMSLNIPFKICACFHTNFLIPGITSLSSWSLGPRIPTSSRNGFAKCNQRHNTLIITRWKQATEFVHPMSKRVIRINPSSVRNAVRSLDARSSRIW